MSKIVLTSAKLRPDGTIRCPDCGAICRQIRDRIPSRSPARTTVRAFFLECEKCGGRHQTRPNGTLVTLPADARTRYFRAKAHDAFDPLVLGILRHKSIQSVMEKARRNRQRQIKRILATHRRHCYRWLAAMLGLTWEDAHIGYMNVSQCQNVIAVCEGMTTQKILDWKESQNESAWDK